MPQSFSRPEDIRRKLRFLGEEVPDVDLQQELEEANRELDGIVSRYHREKVVIEDTTQRTFDLDFAPILTFNKAYLVREKSEGVIGDSNYTIDEVKGQISFNQSYGDDEFNLGTEIELLYVPEIHKDLEVWIAVKNILKYQLVSQSDDQMSTKVEFAREKVNELKKDINSKVTSTTVLDHYPSGVT